MDLRLYNSLTRQKDVFVPIDASDVRLYVCGPTVYDRAHIGNARPLIVFDVLFRLLRQTFGADHVRYVRNITDVDDKILARAAERGIGIDALTETTIRGFEEDWAGLGCLRPTEQPRATDHIAEMIAVIERLVAGGHAYVAQGHVLFDTPSMPDYGALSRRPLDEMIAGARVEVAGYKASDTDFVLWKPAGAGEPGWDSPWGRGRPGWHIECSAMSWAHLGEVFDIHGGGIDLIFPHHENELAQSRCAFGHAAMANVWMHNGFLQVEGEKMSKSAGNFVTIHDLLATEAFGGRSWPGEVLRLAMLRKHYRSPIDWTVQALEEVEKTLDRWRNRLELEPAFDGSHAEVDSEFETALVDDLNVPQALTRVHQLFNAGHWKDKDSSADERSGFFGFGKGHEFVSKENILRNKATAVTSLKLLGIDLTARKDVTPEIKRLIDARHAARKAKDFAESDRLRNELARMGVTLKDNKDGTTTWTPAAGGPA